MNSVLRDYLFEQLRSAHRVGDIDNVDFAAFQLRQSALQCGQVDIIRQVHRLAPLCSFERQFGEFKFACSRGHLNICKYMQKKFQFDHLKDEYDAFRIACLNGRIQVVKWLFYQVPMSSYNVFHFALRWAIREGDSNVTKWLLRASAYVPQCKKRILQLACFFN
jgi:hypothetical protein